MKGKIVSIKVDPIGKPRMTQRDKWLHKKPFHTLSKKDQSHVKAVQKYRAFSTELKLKCKLAGIKLDGELKCIFYIAMPKSWSQKKKNEMLGKPHQQKPDIDNLCKSVMDSLLKDDSGVYAITARKVWSHTGMIEFII